MSLGLRGFVEFVVNKINENGVRSSGWSEGEIRGDVIDMIWDAYREWDGEE